MRPAYAYLGIGIVTILAILAFALHPAVTPKENTDILSVGTTSMTFMLTSTAFGEGDLIPSLYTCDGSQKSPPFSIAGAPDGTKSFAIIMEDPDVPKQIKPDGVFLHWVVFDIPVNIAEIPEGSSSGVQGQNGAGKSDYTGPCPPAQYEPSTHRYVFTLYALDATLSLPPGASKDAVVAAMQAHVLGTAQLMGKYKKK